MPTRTKESNQRKMLRATSTVDFVAEEGQRLSDNQALALAMQELALAMSDAARKLLKAAETHRGY